MRSANLQQKYEQTRTWYAVHLHCTPPPLPDGPACRQGCPFNRKRSIFHTVGVGISVRHFSPIKGQSPD